MFDWLAIVPALVGLALLVIGAVSRRTARRRPFA
jgi:heme exporter protein D